MSIEAYKAAWAARCPGGTKSTLLAIAEFASSSNGYTCCASVGTIAEMIQRQERQVIRNLRALADNGLITIQPQRGRGNTNTYDMSHLIKPVADDRFYNAKTLSSVTGFNGENLSSKASKPVTDDTQTIYNNHNNKFMGKQKNGGMNGNGQYVAPLPDHIWQIITALTEISGTVYQPKTEDDYEMAAYYLHDLGCDETHVAAFAPYWKKNGFYKTRPKLKSIVDEFRNFLDDLSGKAQEVENRIPEEVRHLIRR